MKSSSRAQTWNYGREMMKSYEEADMLIKAMNKLLSLNWK